jgi:hypothetical protein
VRYAPPVKKTKALAPGRPLDSGDLPPAGPVSTAHWKHLDFKPGATAEEIYAALMKATAPPPNDGDGISLLEDDCHKGDAHAPTRSRAWREGDPRLASSHWIENSFQFLKEAIMRRPVISIVVFSLGFGATASRALGVAPENVLQGESGVAAGSGRASSVESSRRNPLTQPGCTICLGGTGSIQWTGGTGSFHVDTVSNNRGSGTSGSLDLSVVLTSSAPVYGQTIYSYSFSDSYSLSPLLAGYQYSNVNSGAVGMHGASIPAGQYWQLLYLREYSGGTWHYADWIVMPNKVSCSGAGCTVVTACTEDAYTMCLGGGRYKVTSRWRNQYVGETVTTPMLKTDLTDVVGAFWKDAGAYQFFVSVNPATAALNGHTWVAMNTFSGVEFWIDVTDTVSGQSREYHNPPENKTLVEDRTFFVYP